MAEEQDKDAAKAAWLNNEQVKNKDDSDEGWEKKLIANIAMGALTEQRRARRWGIFFKLCMLAYVVVFLLILLPGRDGGSTSSGNHTALIDINGVIAADAEANADSVVTALRKAFEDEGTRGLILRINSPGGSPVQAGYINDEIMRLREKYPDIPVYAVVADVCASGGYYIAAAAQEIYANKASMVGSIGVVMSGFGFVDTMEKLGIERRLLTAGESKGLLDPFSPVNHGEVSHVKSMLESIHQQFIAVVKEGRGDRLKGGDELFSGLIWTGEQSLELGLIDGLGSASYVARELVGEADIVDFTFRPDPLERFAEKLGVGAMSSMVKALGISSELQ